MLYPPEGVPLVNPDDMTPFNKYKVLSFATMLSYHNYHELLEKMLIMAVFHPLFNMPGFCNCDLQKYEDAKVFQVLVHAADLYKHDDQYWKAQYLEVCDETN